VNWLDELVTGTDFSESPSRYYWWAGVAAISSVMGKQVFMNRHAYKLYPNVYVALVSAKSGLRKGAPIATAKGIVEKLEMVRVISGCNSIQGLTSELSHQKTFPSGLVVDKAQGLLCSDELEAFLTEDPRALTILTALHNTHEHEKEWTKSLKNSPQEVLKEPCLTLLVASNEVLFHSMIKDKDMEGGFIARTFIVYETYRRRINSLVYKPDFILDKTAMGNALRKMAEVKGEFLWSPEAGEFYDKWYTDMCLKPTDDRTGTMERHGDQVLKLAMILEVATGAGFERPLHLTLDNIKVAIEAADACLAGVRTISMGASTANAEQDKAVPVILRKLLEAPEFKLSRQTLLVKTSLDAMVFDRAVETLKERNTILSPQREGGKIMYSLTPETIAIYKKTIPT
jgi:hypothetical protein